MRTGIKLSQYQQDMLDGQYGYPRQWAMQQLMQVAHFFGASDFVAVSQAHIMCDTESLGEAGIVHLEHLASHVLDQRTVAIPAITDPRGIDLCAYQKLNQSEEFVDREQRTTRALKRMGILMTDTCINYQSVVPPVFGEHIAFGDTGSTIYANSVFGARSNFEGGPAGLAAALTGCVPRYGYHLDDQRIPTHLFIVDFQPKTLSDWGALGAVIGKLSGSYWSTPFITGVDVQPSSDALKHLGAAIASYGSVPLYLLEGISPEAENKTPLGNIGNDRTARIDFDDIKDLYANASQNIPVDVVVFAAPQLSLFEIQDIVAILNGRRVHRNTQLFVATSPEIKHACDRFGITDCLEQSGAVLLSGVCFYQMYARELAQANDWKTLVSNSAKLVNIIAGYGYEPMLATTEQCINAAVTGIL